MSGGSYGLALDLANAWEPQVRQYKKTHAKAINSALIDMIEDDARRNGATPGGLWNCTDVANKACEILAERLGEKYKVALPEKLI